MKKVALLVVAAMAMGAGAQAQSDPDMTNAILAMRNNDLAKAKTDIDKAAAKPKINVKPKVWRYKAEIYERILRTNDPKLMASLGDSGVTAAMKAVNKTLELDEKGGEHYKVAEGIKPNLTVYANNMAINAYNAKDYMGAYKGFMLLTTLKPSDKGAYENAIIVANTAENFPAMAATKAAMEKNNVRVSDTLYKTLGSAALRKGDTATFYKLMIEGREKYPNDKDFINQELRYYMTQGKSSELRAKLEQNIAQQPGNVLFYQMLGQMYGQEGKDLARAKKNKEAHVAQLKAIEIYQNGLSKANPDMDSKYDLLYNTGVMYIDIANPAADSLYAFGPKTPPALKTKVENRVNTMYKAALNSFDQAYAIKQDDPALLRVMMKLNGHFRNEAKVNELNAKLEKLTK